jgi:putative spermidine/putrescine transport system permease protein
MTTQTPSAPAPGERSRAARTFTRRAFPLWSWLWFILGALYFILPLYATLDFSLRMERDTIGLKAYASAFADPEFARTFGYSVLLAIVTILVSILLVVPTAYWIRLRLPEARRIVEFILL